MKRLWSLLGLSLLACLLGSLPLFPASRVLAMSQSQTLLEHHAMVIAKGQSIEDALVLGHHAIVAGTVRKMIVVVDGNLTLLPTSKTDIAIDLGGRLTIDPGARVRKILHLSLASPFWNGLFVGVLIGLLLWCGWFLLSVGGGIVTIGLAGMLQKNLADPLRLLEQSVRRAGATGLLVSLLALSLAAMLATTLVGFALAIVVIIAYLLLGVVGFPVVAVWLGQLFWPKIEVTRPLWQHAIVGTLILLAVFTLPVIGLFLFLLVEVTAVGIATRWLWLGWSRRKAR